jgi:hypothetical protein
VVLFTPSTGAVATPVWLCAFHSSYGPACGAVCPFLSVQQNTRSCTPASGVAGVVVALTWLVAAGLPRGYLHTLCSSHQKKLSMCGSRCSISGGALAASRRSSSRAFSTAGTMQGLVTSGIPYAIGAAVLMSAKLLLLCGPFD